MSCLAPFTCFFQSTKRIGQGTILDESQRQSPHTASIHILDDDSLLHIFYLYRPAIFDRDGKQEFQEEFRFGGGMDWNRERWWYKITHVCQRWRNLVLRSSSHLGLSLVCTYGTPVLDMLAHSPPLPIIIDYSNANRDITTEDEEGIILALERRDRLRRVRLRILAPELQKFIIAIDEEYPMLEYLIMGTPKGKSTAMILPETLQAPHLRHLTLYSFFIPIGSRLLTTAVGIVSLALYVYKSSVYFRPDILLHWLSFMPQLEKIQITFSFPVPNCDVERQLIKTPITTHIILPNLRWFGFRGVSAYMEAVVCRITTPRLETLQIQFFKQLTFSFPRLLQFINTTENLKFDSARFIFFGDEVDVEMRPREAEMHALSIGVFSWHLDWQVSSVAQIFGSLSPIFSTVEHLAFEHEVHSQSYEEHNEVNRTEWHKLLKPFSNVKTLRVGDGLVKELSRCLRMDDGELPLELLPDLQEPTYSGGDDTGDACHPWFQLSSLVS